MAFLHSNRNLTKALFLSPQGRDFKNIPSFSAFCTLILAIKLIPFYLILPADLFPQPFFVCS